MKSFRLYLSLVLLSLLPLAHAATPWFPLGPDGGDARAFAIDPHNHAHIYLGAANGWIYDSKDNGAHWTRLARVGQRDDLVIDSIVVNQATPNRILVGAWVIDHPDGGIFLSTDGGKSWTMNADMKGRSIRALAAAPSNASTVIAGALDGVYQSTDAGVKWNLISPAGSTEIHEIESIAIDPKDPKIIYAGTWHLPWKTTDGGAHWNNIKQGIIEDSDVFSIIVDPRDPNVVYASACSGIYKSTNAAANFTKVQGIPSTARRTRVLMQDPKRSDIVFAGTTEGLWRTADSGHQWLRNGGPEVIVNDVLIDPQDTQHVLLATDRGGVVMSDDGGFTFHPSNTGFSSRQVMSYAANPAVPGQIAVGVVNDKTFGGVFTSSDNGVSWSQYATGLEGRDVFSLLRTQDSTLLAGTSHGIYKLNGEKWVPSGLLLSPVKVKTVTRKTAKGKIIVVPVKSAPVPPAKHFDSVVYAMASNGQTAFAAAGDKLVVSVTGGAGWLSVPELEGKEWRYVAVQGNNVLAGGLRNLAISNDGGTTWKLIQQPQEIQLLASVAVDGKGHLWVAGRESLMLSMDNGATWQKVPSSYFIDVNSVSYDAAAQRLLVTVNHPTMAYGINQDTLKVTYLETGWNLRFLRNVGDHLVGATMFDGLVMQPQMVNSPLAGK